MTCRYCSQPITTFDYFCPSCGKKLKEKPISTEFWPLVWLFVLSLFFPPFGLGKTIRYIRSEDEKAKVMGWLSLIVTVVAIIVTIWISKTAMDNVNKQINTQLENYSI